MSRNFQKNRIHTSVGPDCNLNLQSFVKYCTIFFFILFFSSSKIFAQTFPVQISTQLIPPFSGYIPDYAAGGNENFRILILFTDFSRPTYDVKLKIKIEGQGIIIQSHSWYFAGPFTLEPGVPTMLSGNDLAGLLNENNLQFSGITRQQYDLRKVLPEGFYTITVTAYDFVNPIPILVSNEGITQAWMVLNDPPYLNLPFCGSSVAPTTPQQITFSWTAMNLAAPSSALGSEYTFDLWEIFPANQAPGNIVASTAPIYSYTSSQTLLNYGIAEPALVVGREYVWRVHAQDLESRELFRNNGFSELCTLSYGTTLDLLGNLAHIQLNAQALTSRQARCWWDSLAIYSQYRLQFRKTNTPNWFPFTTNQASLRIPDLEANTNYEAEVIGIMPNGEEGPVSNIATWHTPEKQIFNCGESSPAPAQQNFHPLTQANTGMIWEIGQFEMIVTSLQSNANPAGWYSGLGKVTMPLGWTLACTFTNLHVGEDHVIYSGEVNAITEGVGVWLAQFTMNNLLAFVDTSISATIDTIIVNGNLITIETDNGPIVITTYTFPYVIQDGNGTTYIINEDGTYTIQFLVPHIDLSAHQINIYKLALGMVKTENTPAIIGTNQSNLTNARVAYTNYLTNDLGIDYSSPGTASLEYVAFNETSFDSTNQSTLPPLQQTAVKVAEYNLVRAKVCNAFAKDNPTSFDLDLLANYLIIEAKLSHIYIAERIAAGDTDQTIALEVKSSIYRMIDGILLTKVFIKPADK